MTPAYVDTGARSEDRNTWLELRRSGIGASEAAAVVGESRWSEPAKIYAIKVGLEVDDDGHERLEWGLRHEPTILEAYSSARYAGRPARRDGRLLRSSSHPFMLATLDAWTTWDRHFPDVPLELKTTESRNADAWDEGTPRADGKGIDTVPTEYWWQLQHQMFVTSESRASIACLLGPHRLMWCDVERDDVAIRRLLAACSDLWDRVCRHGTDDESPPTSRNPDVLRRLFPREDGRTIELSGRFIDLDHERERVTKKLRELEKRQREIDAEIQCEMRAAERCVLPGGASYSWKTVSYGERLMPARSSRVFRRHAPSRKEG